MVIMLYSDVAREKILSRAGSGNWPVDQEQAKQLEFAVVVRHTGLAEFVFKVRDVIPSDEDPDLSFIAGSDYAEVKVPYLFNGSDKSRFRIVTGRLGD